MREKFKKEREMKLLFEFLGQSDLFILDIASHSCTGECKH